MAGGGTCKFCKREIETNLDLHEVHCQRHLAVCEKCGEQVPRVKMAEHEEEEHASVACQHCEKDVEKHKLEDHQANCKKRPANCHYCELTVEHRKLEEHQEFCGTRTEKCPNCSQYIMIKDQTRHEDSNCTFPPSREAPGTSALPPVTPPPGSMRGVPRDNSFVTSEFRRMTGFDRPTVTRYRTKDAPGSTAASKGPGAKRLPQRRTPGRSRDDAIPDKRETPRKPFAGQPPISVASGRPKPTPAHTAGGQKSGAHGVRGGSDASRASSRNTGVGGSISRATLKREEAQETLLPCQYCDMMTPADTLMEHQENCPENSTRVHELMTSAFESIGTSAAAAAAAGDSSQDYLPCEICDQLFPMSHLIEHQNQCGDRHLPPTRTVIDRAQNEGGFPCEFCRRPFSPDTLVGHQATCQDQPPTQTLMNRFAESEARGYADDGDVLFPCEFCGDILPEDELIQHQAVCQDQRAMPGRSRPAPVPRPVAFSVGGLGASRPQPPARVQQRLAPARNTRPAAAAASNSRRTQDSMRSTGRSQYASSQASRGGGGRGRQTGASSRTTDRSTRDADRSTRDADRSTQQQSKRDGTFVTDRSGTFVIPSDHPTLGSDAGDSSRQGRGRQEAAERRPSATSSRNRQFLADLMDNPTGSGAAGGRAAGGPSSNNGWRRGHRVPPR